MLEKLFENPFQAQLFGFLWMKLQGITLSELTGIVMLVTLGYVLLIPWRKSLRPLELVGLIFPFGVSGMGVILLLFLLLFPSYLSFESLACSILLICWIILSLDFLKNKKEYWKWPHMMRQIKRVFQRVKELNLIQILCLMLISYILFVIGLKGIFWPILDWDAITTFDFYGRSIAVEKELITSIVRDKSVGSGVAYPPLTHLMIAYSYLAGFYDPKIFFTLTYVSFILAFYAFTRRFVNRTGSMIIVLLMIMTPELTAFSTFCKTNILQMLFSSLGILVFFRWMSERKLPLLYLAAVLVGFGAWVRSEGVEFVLIPGLFLFYETIRGQLKWNQLIGYGVIGLVPFLFWQIFLSATPELGHYQQVEVEKSIFWDAEKLYMIIGYLQNHLASVQYYGLASYFLILLLVINLLFFKRAHNHQFGLILLGLVIMHVFLLYQLHYKGDNMEWLLKYSLKRYIFNWIPLIYFFIGTSFGFQWLTRKLESFLKLQPKEAK